jgi:hypothetical protein
MRSDRLSQPGGVAMTTLAVPTRHDASPDAALAALDGFAGPLLLDLDETLYLGNSTEDFIDSAHPRVAAAALMKVLEWIAPWRWTGGEATRDVWRVQLVTLLFPWTAHLWRRRAPRLVGRFANAPLMRALRGHSSRPIIVTLGFRPIVAPLVAALNLGESAIVAARPARFADRMRGKLGLARDALGEDTVRRGLVITDSADDLPLLEACTRPLRTVWPGARGRAALSDIYVPGRYLTRIKRPGERYIVRGILQEDFAFWVLASVGIAAAPVTHVAGLLLLLLSFWTIYERGYVDNDRIAARHERDPRLSPAFSAAPVPTPRWEPWVWALAAGAGAIALLRWPAGPAAADFAAWTGVLLATHGWFLLYNRFDKRTRVWLYPGLQVARSAAFMALVPVVAVGTAALGAHVLAKWLPYYLYRFGGPAWPKAPLPLTRLLFFVVLALLLGLGAGPAVFTGSAAALLAWNVLRARADLRAAIRRARRIDRTVPPAPRGPG